MTMSPLQNPHIYQSHNRLLKEAVAYACNKHPYIFRYKPNEFPQGWITADRVIRSRFGLNQPETAEELFLEIVNEAYFPNKGICGYHFVRFMRNLDSPEIRAILSKIATAFPDFLGEPTAPHYAGPEVLTASLLELFSSRNPVNLSKTRALLYEHFLGYKPLSISDLLAAYKAKQGFTPNQARVAQYINSTDVALLPEGMPGMVEAVMEACEEYTLLDLAESSILASFEDRLMNGTVSGLKILPSDRLRPLTPSKPENPHGPTILLEDVVELYEDGVVVKDGSGAVKEDSRGSGVQSKVIKPLNQVTPATKKADVSKIPNPGKLVLPPRSKKAQTVTPATVQVRTTLTQEQLVQILTMAFEEEICDVPVPNYFGTEVRYDRKLSGVTQREDGSFDLEFELVPGNTPLDRSLRLGEMNIDFVEDSEILEAAEQGVTVSQVDEAEDGDLEDLWSQDPDVSPFFS